MEGQSPAEASDAIDSLGNAFRGDAEVDKLSDSVHGRSIQTPLLPENVPHGVHVCVARRSGRCLAGFFSRALRGHRSVDTSDVDTPGDVVRLAGICVMVISEVSLVHYTKKAKPLKATNDNKQALDSTVDEKYWKRRYNYFSRFDEGVRMDQAAWFEVTPESVAWHLADRLRFGLVVDGTCGVGGNAIQFALTSDHVIGVDIDASRLRDAQHNAKVYGVRDKIDFVCDDFVQFATTYDGPPVDLVFISPPWGGPAHLDSAHFSLKDVEVPDIVRLFSAAVLLSPRVVLYLPRHIDLHEVVMLAHDYGFAAVEVEKVFFQYPTPHLKLCVVYFVPESDLRRASALTVAKTVNQRQRAPVRKQQCNQSPDLCVEDASENDPFPLCAMTRTRSALLSSLPLAGPLTRAMTCQFHYIGRYVVALALQDSGTSTSSQTTSRHKRPRGMKSVSSGPSVREGNPKRKGPIDGREENVQVEEDAAFRNAVALQLCMAEVHGEVSDDTVERMSYILEELPLGEVLSLVNKADVANASSTSPFCTKLFEELQRCFPEVHDRLLARRNTAAVDVFADIA